MNNQFSFKSMMRKALILSASFLLAFISCKKTGELTPDFVENSSLSFFTDSITIQTQTRKGDSVWVDRISTGLVGYYQDSVFGKAISTFYVQPVLPSNGVIFKEADEEAFIDSIVLSLQYARLFGDSSVEQTIDVFQLDEKINLNGLYFSDTNIQVKPNILGSKTFKPRIDKQVTVYRPSPSGGTDTLSLNPQIRIRLDDALGSEILSKSGQIELSTNEEFTSFFNGLKVAPNTNVTLNNNESAISHIALTASETKMTIYYRKIAVGGEVTKSVVDFPINSSSARFNTFQHDYSGSVIENVLNGTHTDSLYTYTQAMAGVETVVKFPNIKEQFKGENIIINKAELVFPIANGSYAKFGVPPNLIVASRSDLGILQFIPDFFEGEEFLGGAYDVANGTYTFNISRYIQGLINGTQNENGLTLLVTAGAVSAERAVLFSENNPSNKIKLNLYYSKTQ